MYRSYENPRKLEKELEDARRRLSDAQARGEDDLIDLYQEVAELEERVNYAWQDDEYEEASRQWAEFEAWVQENNGIPADPELPFN